jgi:UDP-glucose 4-epimerase
MDPQVTSARSSASNLTVLRGARVLVTGGAGLIGSHLAGLLLGAGVHELRVIDNLSRGRRSALAKAESAGRVQFLQGDIGDRALLAEACRGADFLFHLAAIRLTQCAEQPRLALEVMVDGTYNVLEAAIAGKVKRVIAASSASVYGMADRFPTAEDHHPYNNDTLYGAAKTFNEGLLASFRAMYGLDYVALRPFNVYGPGMDTEGAYTEVLVRWMREIANGRAPVIFGDGRQTMDFIHVGDVARAFLLAATADTPGEVFNVASGIETSLNDLARALITAMGSSVQASYAPARRVSPVRRRLADTARAKERLGFTAEVSLAEGLRDLVAWWRSSSGGPR